jgi:glucose/arabinose dehydrogenase
VLANNLVRLMRADNSSLGRRQAKLDFPAAYRGSAFVALKGSWNRSVPTGYKVVRVPFKDGKPEGYYENFATGFWVSGERRAEVWGRPAALAITADGALLVADDTAGTIWRITYTGDRQRVDRR